MPTSDYTYTGTLVRVIDGDTVVLRLTRETVLVVDVGFHVRANVRHEAVTEQTFRLLGIDTPEVIGDEKKAGLKAKAALEALLKDRALEVTSYKSDKYGRWLADIVVLMPAGKINASLYLLENRFALPYHGHGPKPIAPAT